MRRAELHHLPELAEVASANVCNECRVFKYSFCISSDIPIKFNLFQALWFFALESR